MTPLAKVQARIRAIAERCQGRARYQRGERRCDECHRYQPGGQFAWGSTTCLRCARELSTPRRIA